MANHPWTPKLPRKSWHRITRSLLRLEGVTTTKSTTWDQRLYFPSEGRRAEVSLPLKIRRLQPGLNPWTWVLKASTLPLDHRSHYVLIMYKKIYKTFVRTMNQNSESKQVGPRNNNANLYSGIAWFRSHREYQLPSLSIVTAFLSPYRQMQSQHPTLGYDHFILYSFQFCHSSYN